MAPVLLRLLRVWPAFGGSGLLLDRAEAVLWTTLLREPEAALPGLRRADLQGVVPCGQWGSGLAHGALLLLDMWTEPGSELPSLHLDPSPGSGAISGLKRD